MGFNVMILSLLFLQLGLSSSSYSDVKCPEANKIHPCSCEVDDDGDVLVICESRDTSVEKLKNSLSSLSGKKLVYIWLEHIKLGSLPSTMFNGILARRLDISHCELESLTDDPDQPALAGLEDSLVFLDISASFTKNVGPTNFRLGHMRKLKEIELTRNPIIELNNDWFEKGPASLEKLVISNNAIKKIGDRAFANLSNLKELSLTFNKFGPIRRSMLPNPAERLETLELSNNALTAIPDDLFTNMPALTGVSLQNNEILRLDQTTWQRVWQQLDYASFAGNPIKCDSSMEWTFSMKKHPHVNGMCYSSWDLEYTYLEDLIDRKTRERKA